MTVLLPLLCLMFSLNTLDIPLLLDSYELDSADIPLEEFLSANQYINNQDLQTEKPLRQSDKNGKVIIKASHGKKMLNNNRKTSVVVISPVAKKRQILNNQATSSEDLQQLTDNDNISSGFGKRADPLNNSPKFHKGIDISRPTGTEVFAWANGVVARTGWLRGYGLTVEIVHPNGIKTRYAHLNLTNIRKGQKISKGQLLGQVGETGRTTGANLHFEVVVAGKLSDPLNHLSENDEIVGNGRITMNNG
ncbi:MAG: M23 family metallopeptidase [Desulforhopalus sp.]|nr:M23 family metallopeptidase [Desulforhopalus sp.]